MSLHCPLGDRVSTEHQKPKVIHGIWLCLIAIACFGLFLLFQGSVQGANTRRSPVVEVVERVRPAIVNIHSERSARAQAADYYTPSPSANRVNGMGTGVIIDARGFIITNHHVVDDVSIIRVHLSDGSSHTASLLARDREADLALLKIDAGRRLPTVPLGTARDLMVGETVIAIGNAYGYEHTVTVGVVSAVHRDVTLNKEISYKSLIQTDASINPGNSGGPLLNVNGEVVGINVAIRAGAQGISFAIPVDTAIRAASDMLSTRRRHLVPPGLACRDHVILGGSPDIKLQSARGKTGSDSDAPAEPEWKRELVVEGIEADSPAARTGVQIGDVVTQLAGQDVTCTLDLERALLERAPGEHLPLVVRRGDTSKRLELVLTAAEHRGPSPVDLVWRKIGARLQPVHGDQVARSSQQLHGGLAVVEVETNGVADRSGIQRGDILVGLHTWETLTVDNVAFVLTHPDLATFHPVTFYIIRAGQIRRGWLQPMN
jgi:serine protease Do